MLSPGLICVVKVSLCVVIGLSFSLTSLFSAQPERRTPPHILYVLTDDHRYDALGALGHPFLKTPHLDRLVHEGTLFSQACVTTSLCSPSRASILTGLFAHNHRVVDNYHPVDDRLTFFPQRLQQHGYKTAFIGKWHMGGEQDAPQRGFDHWISFKGQGVYWPFEEGLKIKGRYVPQADATTFNINGQSVPQTGYITDVLTDYASQWLLSQLQLDQPLFLYLSHKAVHADFIPPDRYAYHYEKSTFEIPPTPHQNPDLFTLTPRWVLDQSNSRHGTEFAYYSQLDLQTYYRRYMETLLAVDESLGRLTALLKEAGQLENTIIIYMGDNGFLFGEHGLIDKRNAYEESMRVPLMLAGPNIPAGKVCHELVANIDIAPTILELAGAPPLESIDGQSLIPLLSLSPPDNFRDVLLYEYYWERNYPHTPTTFALRSKTHKFIRYHGIWDLNEYYDIQLDPHERRNKINETDMQSSISAMNAELDRILSLSHGQQIPLVPDYGPKFPLRLSEGTHRADFPPAYYQSNP